MSRRLVLIPKETLMRLKELRAEYEHESDSATLNLAFNTYQFFVVRKAEHRTLRGVDPDRRTSRVIERNYGDLALFTPSAAQLALEIPPKAATILTLLMLRPHAAGDFSAMVVEAVMLLSDITEALKVWPEVGMFHEDGIRYAEINTPAFDTIRRKHPRP